jgi:membrane protease YdiL (CAAX protease family)
MKTHRLSATEWLERIVLALLFTVLGSLIMIVFSPWRPLLDHTLDYLGKMGLTLFLLIVAFLARRSLRFEKYAQLLNGFLILTVAITLDLVFGIYLIYYLGGGDNTPAGFALQKLHEFVVVGCVIILLNKVSGNSLGSIYIQKGKLKLGLIIGLGTFFLAAAGSIPMAQLLFNGRDLTMTRVVPWIPWVLIYVLANGAMEELMFRGLFLRKLEPFFGKFISVFLIAFVFTFLHFGSSYTSDQYVFLAVLFPLALAWGYIIQKTEGVWGSILFHAGMDIPIMLGMFSNF